MSSTNKRIPLAEAQFTMLSGSDKHEVELPHGEIDIWCEWYSDKECVVWIYYDSGLTIPYASGMKGHFNVKTVGAISLVLACPKSATVVTCVKTKNLNPAQHMEWTPVEIIPPRPAEMQISALVNDQVRRELERLGVLTDDKLEIGEEDNLEDEDEDEGFGPGFMEEEEPLNPPPPRRKDKGKPAGGNPAPDVNPGSEPNNPPVPEPKTP